LHFDYQKFDHNQISIYQISEVKFYESFGVEGKYQQLASNDFMKSLEKHSLKFEMKDGVVSKLTPSVKSVQSNVLNVQRGILSSLQLRGVTMDKPEKLVVEVF